MSITITQLTPSATTAEPVLHLRTTQARMRALIGQLISSGRFSLEEQAEIKEWEEVFLTKQGEEAILAVCFFLSKWILPLYKQRLQQASDWFQQACSILSELAPKSSPEETLKNYLALRTQAVQKKKEDLKIQKIIQIFQQLLEHLDEQARQIHAAQIQQAQILERRTIALIQTRREREEVLREGLLNQNQEIEEIASSIHRISLDLQATQKKFEESSLLEDLKHLLEKL